MGAIERLSKGAVAGLLATATMSLAMAVAKSAGLLGEPPPRKLTRKLLGRVGIRVRDRGAVDALSVLAHFGYGAAMGSLYALLPRPLQSTSAGLLYGSAVWSANYQGLVPKLGLMPRPMFDRPGRPTSMALAHLVFGATLGAIFEELASPARTRSRAGSVRDGLS